MANEINSAIELSVEELDVVAGGIGFGDLDSLKDKQSTDFSSLDIATRKKTFSGREGSGAASENRLSAVHTNADNDTFFNFQILPISNEAGKTSPASKNLKHTVN